jgi:hypothetical protein
MVVLLYLLCSGYIFYSENKNDMPAITFQTRYDKRKRFKNVIENGEPYVGQDLGPNRAINYTPPSGFELVAEEGQTVEFTTPTDVAFGAAGVFEYKYGVQGKVTFNTATFGDPIPDYFKAGYAKASEGVPAAGNDLENSGAEVPAPVVQSSNKKYIYMGIGVLVLGLLVYMGVKKAKK